MRSSLVPNALEGAACHHFQQCVHILVSYEIHMTVVALPPPMAVFVMLT